MHGPTERIESENTDFHVVITVRTAPEQELRELGNVLSEQRNFLQEAGQSRA